MRYSQKRGRSFFHIQERELNTPSISIKWYPLMKLKDLFGMVLWCQNLLNGQLMLERDRMGPMRFGG